MLMQALSTFEPSKLAENVHKRHHNADFDHSLLLLLLLHLTLLPKNPPSCQGSEGTGTGNSENLPQRKNQLKSARCCLLRRNAVLWIIFVSSTGWKTKTSFKIYLCTSSHAQNGNILTNDPKACRTHNEQYGNEPMDMNTAAIIEIKNTVFFCLFGCN